MKTTLSIAAEHLRFLGIPSDITPDGRHLTVSNTPWPVTASSHFKAEKLQWVAVRAKGVQTRAIFPTKVPSDLPKAVAKNVLAAMLDMAALAGPEPVPFDFPSIRKP